MTMGDFILNSIALGIGYIVIALIVIWLVLWVIKMVDTFYSDWDGMF